MKMNPSHWSFGVYLRLSREDLLEEGNSIENQKKIIFQFLNNYPDIVLYKCYMDNGYTGTNFNRPSFKEMLKDIKDKIINGIIVKDLSRFGRDYIRTGIYLEDFFPSNNVRFISVNDGIDTFHSTSSFALEIPFKNILNDVYVKDISMKVKATIANKKENGLFFSGNTPYGYLLSAKEKGKLFPDPKTNTIVKRIFSFYLHDFGINQIVKCLNKEEIPSPSKIKKIHTKKETFWTNSTVHKILTNPVYCGDLTFDGKTYFNTHLPIVDRKTFEFVQELLKKKRRTNGIKQEKYLFSGYVRCASCHSFMLAKRKDSSYFLSCSTYTRINEDLCSKHLITSEQLEPLVQKELQSYFSSLEELKGSIKKILKNYSKKEVLLNCWILELHQIIYDTQKRKKEYYEFYSFGIISKKEYTKLSFSFNSYLKILERFIYLFHRLQKTMEEVKKNLSFLENLLKWKKKKLSRKMVEQLIEMIYIEDYQTINVHFKNQDKIDYLRMIRNKQ